MKKRNLFLATLFVVAVVLVAVVSCKKDDPKTMLSDTNHHPMVFTPPQVEDMTAYLKDFKQKMQSATKSDEETLSLEEAAWHLASLANLDFCKVNVEYNNVRFDTIDMQVYITDGTILMSDLNTAYGQMCTEIQQFKKEFSDNYQLYFINFFINGNGNAKIALMTSYTENSKFLPDHPWYFQGAFEALNVCDQYFSDDSTYFWNTLAVTELQRVLNLFEHHENGPTGPGGQLVVCFIPSRNHDFNYTNTYDPYGTDYINDSRVFAIRNSLPSLDYTLDTWELCCCLDSYLGLAYEYINDNLYTNEHPVNWTVAPASVFINNYVYYHYHQLHVEYGTLITPGPPTPDQ